MRREPINEKERLTHLEVQDDGPDEAQRELWITCKGKVALKIKLNAEV